jgi:hypothetical protein
MTMMMLRLIDLDVPVPAGVSISTEPPKEKRVLHTLVGPQVEEVRATIEQMGTSRGYSLRRTDTYSLLERPEHRIEVFPTGAQRLRVRVDDIASLPPSTVHAREIALGPVRIGLSRATNIEPGRERHDRGSEVWRADWCVHGATPEELANDVHDSLKAEGLGPVWVWHRPRGGTPSWLARVEAGTPSSLVQVHIYECDAGLKLEMFVVDSGEPLARADPSGAHEKGRAK